MNKVVRYALAAFLALLAIGGVVLFIANVLRMMAGTANF